MQDDLFAKILTREIPAEILYEDEHTLAFLDVHPVNPGHTLIIPKEYSRNILSITDESFAQVMETVRKLSPIILDAVDAQGINIRMNNEPAAGQVVFRTHVHIIPRHDGDGYVDWRGKDGDLEEMKAVAGKIRDTLGR